LLSVNDPAEPVAVKKFAAGTQDVLTVELADEHLLQPGQNTIRVEITGKNAFPHTLTWSYMALTPANKDACPVRLSTSLSTAKATEGETVSLTAKLQTSAATPGHGGGDRRFAGRAVVAGRPAELRNLVKAG
jgi:hypothetical protein